MPHLKKIYCCGTALLLFLGVFAFNLVSKEKGSKNLAEQIAKLPILFESNAGQTNPAVKYLSRGKGYNFYFAPNEVTLVLHKKIQEKTPPTVLKMRFAGGSQEAMLSGLEEQPCKSNYFIGKDPQNWHTQTPNFAKVCYRDIYPGIDIVFYGNPRQLEYDICVAPGKKPDARLQFEGAKELSIGESGNLCIQTEDDHQIQMQKPFIYQLVDGKKAVIEGSYTLLAKNEVGFKIGDYDTKKSLVIDPVMSYSTYLGGSNADFANAITVDSAGNTYVTGATNSTDFPPFSLPPLSLDVFVVKIDPTASMILYATFLGGSGQDFGNDLEIDLLGNAYVTGQTLSPDFPTTLGAYQTLLKGSSDGYVTKLDPTGSTLLYSTYLGGSNFDFTTSIAIDSSGNAFVTGQTNSTDFPVTSGTYQPSLLGGLNAFVTKLNSLGTGLVYSTYLGGSQIDFGTEISVDSSGNAFVFGETSSSDFPTTSGAFQKTMPGAGNTFITKFNSFGNGLIYSTFLGGSDSEQSGGLFIDPSGNAYVTGSTISSDFPTTPGVIQSTLALDAENTFITKLNSTGSALIYSTFFGGSVTGQGEGIVADSRGNAYIIGLTESANFPLTSNALQTVFPGNSSVFLVKINPTATILIYSSFLGGPPDNDGSDIAINGDDVYLTGNTESSSFPVTAGVFQPIFGGEEDAFVSKFTFAPPAITNVSPNSGTTDGGTAVVINGVNFTGTTAVYFGSTKASSFTVLSDTEIVAISPAEPPGTVDITVVADDITPITLADQFTFISFPPISPSDFTGEIVKNKHLTFTEYVRVLTWKSSPDPHTVGYALFRNGTLVAIFNAQPGKTVYEFEEVRSKKSKDVYTLVGFNKYDTPSAPSTVTLP